jgi:heptosyltransferase I
MAVNAAQEPDVLPLQKPPESLCILRLSALGDATHVLPVLRALQDRWPDTRITWVIGKLERRLLQGVDGVEFIVFDKRGGWAEVRKLRAALRGRAFDVLLHMQVAARANLLSRLVRAPVRLGWDRARSRDFHPWFTNCQVAAVPLQHQVQGFLEFPRALGLAVDRPRWDLPIADAAREWAAAQLAGDRPTLLISPCSSHARRNWRPEYYAEVADYAAASLGLRVVLSGGLSDLERAVAGAIEAAMRMECLNLVGKDTLEQSKALLQRAALVLSPDAGPVHVASALGTPVLGLYAATWSRRSGPYNSLELCVDRYEEAARKYRGKPAGELRWGHRIEEAGVMDLVQPADVIEKLRAFVGREKGDGAS